MKLVTFTELFYSPAGFLFSVAARDGLGTCLGITVKYSRRKAFGAAGNGLGTTIKYLRRTRNGAAGSGLGTTIKYL
jgi:hypothetical protein